MSKGVPIRPRIFPHGVAVGWKSEYISWTCMIRRCLSPKYRQFYLYGGRGIGVCERWFFGDGRQCGFSCFIADMGRKPNTQFTIDRIDGDGNYEPSNCRWASKQTQDANRRIISTPGTTSNFLGVYHRVSNKVKPWEATIKVNGKTKWLGSHATEIEAGIAYDNAAHKKDGSQARLNFPERYRHIAREAV